MRMIGGLQWVAHTQSSQYMFIEVNWVGDDPPLQNFA